MFPLVAGTYKNLVDDVSVNPLLKAGEFTVFLWGVWTFDVENVDISILFQIVDAISACSYKLSTCTN